MPPQSEESAETEAETIIIYLDPNRGQALAVLCWVLMLSERKTPKNSSPCVRKDKTGRERRRARRKAERLPGPLLCFSVCFAGKQKRGRLG